MKITWHEFFQMQDPGTGLTHEELFIALSSDPRKARKEIMAYLAEDERNKRKENAMRDLYCVIWPRDPKINPGHIPCPDFESKQCAGCIWEKEAKEYIAKKNMEEHS